MRITGRTLAVWAYTVFTSVAVQTATADDLVIGVVHATTGAVAGVGINTVNGINLAADEINASGMLGKDKLKFVNYDTASDKGQAVSLITRAAVQDEALMVLGPTSSTEGIAAAPLAQDLKIPIFTTAISEEVLKAGPWAFKGTTTADVFMTGIGNYAAEKLKIKRPVLIFDRTSDGAVAQKNVFKQTLEQNGVIVLSEESVLGTDTDFTGLATKVVAAEPDAIFISAQAPVAANVLLQIKQAGLASNVAVLGISSFSTREFVNIAGAAAEGAILPGDFVPGGMNDAGEKFVADYKARFDVEPDGFSAIGYTMMKVAADAIKRASPSPTREKVRDALAQTKDFPTILGAGSLTIGEGRRVSYGSAILTIKDGKFTLAQ